MNGPTNAEVRRTMTGNMPSGEYDMAEQRFTVREIPKVEEEPSTVPDYELYDGITICAKDAVRSAYFEHANAIARQLGALLCGSKS